jgi:hypothetical protein
MREIGLDREAINACRQLLCLVFARQVRECDGESRPRELFHNRPAHALRPAGDECDFFVRLGHSRKSLPRRGLAEFFAF